MPYSINTIMWWGISSLKCNNIGIRSILYYYILTPYVNLIYITEFNSKSVMLTSVLIVKLDAGILSGLDKSSK